MLKSSKYDRSRYNSHAGRGAAQLPPPSEAAQAHSQRLQTHLAHLIQAQKGKISFHDYMKCVLYEPGLGYYSAGAHKLGEAGDFITAPELSPLFGATIAKSLMHIIHALNHSDWLEFGAGTGKFAAHILQYLTIKNALPEKYFILEITAD